MNDEAPFKTTDRCSFSSKNLSYCTVRIIINLYDSNYVFTAHNRDYCDCYKDLHLLTKKIQIPQPAHALFLQRRPCVSSVLKHTSFSSFDFHEQYFINETNDGMKSRFSLL